MISVIVGGPVAQGLVEWRVKIYERSNRVLADDLTAAEDNFINAIGGVVEPAKPAMGNTFRGVMEANRRDKENRRKLDNDLRDMEAKRRAGERLSDEELHRHENIEQIDRQLKNIAVQRDPNTGESLKAQLYEYDPAAFNGDGRAIIGVGDMDTAKNVAFMVPGITSNVRSMDSDVTNGINLFKEARRKAPHESAATVVWMGYDAPSGPLDPATFTDARARAGGLTLANDVERFAKDRKQAGRGQGIGAEDHLQLTVLGHSYGSATTAYAASHERLKEEVDDIVLLGSPGASTVTSAHEFGLAEGSVYAAEDPDDPVGWLGGGNIPGWGGRAAGIGLGTDPNSQDFGATILIGENPDSNPIGQHTSYYSTESELLPQFAGVMTGSDQR